MITWINLFEKYRVDLRVLELYRDELASLAEHSHRRVVLTEAIRRVEQSLHASERLLAHYGDGVLAPREAIQLADERLFLAYRYIYGLTMEGTALEMGISRDTVYRIRRRIIARDAIPDEVLHRFGIQDLSGAIGRTAATDSSSHQSLTHTSGDASSPRPPLPCPVPLTDVTDDVSDILSACFAGAPRGIPAALMATGKQ